jgi:hypothetical protein
MDSVSIHPLCLVAGTLASSRRFASNFSEDKMERQVRNISAAKKGVAVVEQPPEKLTREERIRRLAQAIIRASAWAKAGAPVTSVRVGPQLYSERS